MRLLILFSFLGLCVPGFCVQTSANGVRYISINGALARENTFKGLGKADSLYADKIESTRLAVDKIVSNLEQICGNEPRSQRMETPECNSALGLAEEVVQGCVKMPIKKNPKPATAACQKARDGFEAWFKTWQSNKPKATPPKGWVKG